MIKPETLIIRECKKVKDPVIIIHPESKFNFGKNEAEIKHSKDCPIDRIYLVAKANLYQFNLDDIEAV